MADPDGILRGAHLKLKKVGYVTYQPGDAIPTDVLVRYTSEAPHRLPMRGTSMAPVSTDVSDGAGITSTASKSLFRRECTVAAEIGGLRQRRSGSS